MSRRQCQESTNPESTLAGDAASGTHLSTHEHSRRVEQRRELPHCLIRPVLVLPSPEVVLVQTAELVLVVASYLFEASGGSEVGGYITSEVKGTRRGTAPSDRIKRAQAVASLGSLPISAKVCECEKLEPTIFGQRAVPNLPGFVLTGGGGSRQSTLLFGEISEAS